MIETHGYVEVTATAKLSSASVFRLLVHYGRQYDQAQITSVTAKQSSGSAPRYSVSGYYVRKSDGEVSPVRYTSHFEAESNLPAAVVEALREQLQLALRGAYETTVKV